MEKCKWCGGKLVIKDRIFKDGSRHLDSVCDDCGKSNGFIKQPKNIETGELATESQNKYAYDLMRKCVEKDKHLTQRVAGGIIGLLKDVVKNDEQT